MAKIYLSSTYSDLKEYRQAVYHALRQMRRDVIAMEDYVATDQRPLAKCLADVAACDYYVGLFAWRYGYTPDQDNPDQKSITELEYRHASDQGKPCLIFLLHEDVPWPRQWIDEVTGDGDRGQRIDALRRELQREKTVTFFKTPDQLATRVTTAISQWETEQRQKEQAASSQAGQGDLSAILLPYLVAFFTRLLGPDHSITQYFQRKLNALDKENQ